MKQTKNIPLFASLVGLATYFLPVVSAYGESLAPNHDIFVEYFDAPSSLVLFCVWYGSFVLSLLLSLVKPGNLVLNRLRLGALILLNLFGLYAHRSLTNEILGNASLGIGGILFYLAALVIILASVLEFKSAGININAEDLKKAGEKGLAISKTTAGIATKVAKTAVKEVKKEIAEHRSKGE